MGRKVAKLKKEPSGCEYSRPFEFGGSEGDVVLEPDVSSSFHDPLTGEVGFLNVADSELLFRGSTGELGPALRMTSIMLVSLVTSSSGSCSVGDTTAWFLIIN